MPGITALLHTANDALRLGRALETLRPCDEILIVDHGSRDDTLRIAREYGARILALAPGGSPTHYLQFAQQDWILCLEARESLTEALEASLFEWKSKPPPQRNGAAFSVLIREETPGGWISLSSPQTRLIPRDWTRWNGHLPADHPSALALEGELLRFRRP
jgi:hypothetical protein